MKPERAGISAGMPRAAAALLALCLALSWAPQGSGALAAEGACPKESGEFGNWTFFANAKGWVLKPKTFGLLPRIVGDPAREAFFRQSVSFRFSRDSLFSPRGAELLLFVDAFTDPPPGLVLWAEIDGASVLEPPVPAANPNSGTAGVNLDPGQTDILMARMERGNQAEFWFATKEASYMAVSASLAGFSKAWRRAREVYSAAVAKSGGCDPNDWLKD